MLVKSRNEFCQLRCSAIRGACGKDDGKVSTVCKALLVAAFAATAVQSYGLDITAWKGETVNAFLPDGENVAVAKDGFEVKVGALKGVAYSQAP